MRTMLNKQECTNKSDSSNQNELYSNIITSNSKDNSNKNSNNNLNIPYILSKYPFNFIKHIDNMFKCYD